MAEVVEIPAAFALGPRLTFGFITDMIFTPMAHYITSRSITSLLKAKLPPIRTHQ